jgi:hypothetical protein
MRLLIRKISSFNKLTPRQRKFVFWVFGLSIYRYILRLVGSDKAFTEKIKVSYDKNAEPTKEQLAIALDIAKAIQIADRYILWPNVCRHHAWQAAMILMVYGIPYIFHVGVRKNAFSKIVGHAWISSGSIFISGGEMSMNFKKINF